jgi:hypothetical protein
MAADGRHVCRGSRAPSSALRTACNKHWKCPGRKQLVMSASMERMGDDGEWAPSNAGSPGRRSVRNHPGTVAAGTACCQRMYIPSRQPISRHNLRAGLQPPITVTSAQPESAFTPIAGMDLELLLSSQHERVVRGDSTVAFEGLTLQLPASPDRRQFARCPVLVHELSDGHLVITYQGQQLARFDPGGQRPPEPPARATKSTSSVTRETPRPLLFFGWSQRA